MELRVSGDASRVCSALPVSSRLHRWVLYSSHALINAADCVAAMCTWRTGGLTSGGRLIMPLAQHICMGCRRRLFDRTVRCIFSNPNNLAGKLYWHNEGLRRSKPCVPRASGRVKSCSDGLATDALQLSGAAASLSCTRRDCGREKRAASSFVRSTLPC